MKTIKTPSWVLEGPMDYEYKSYRMFMELEELGHQLKNGGLFQVLVNVDDTLDYLYRYDAEKITSHDDLSNYDLVGIDWQTFSLEFSDDPNIERDEIMDSLCDLAIDKYEELHSKIRDYWRDIEIGLSMAYVPKKPYFLSDGFVFIVTPDNMLHSYYFHKPMKYFVNSWKDFKIERLQVEEYKEEKYFKHIEELIKKESDKIILKIKCDNNVIIENNSMAVIQHQIYNRLKQDFGF
jgi:hypothetical protein